MNPRHSADASRSLRMATTCAAIAIGNGIGSPASAANYQDWWWNPAQSGMGLNVGHQENMVAVSWYLYGSDSKGEFLVFSGPLNGNAMTGSLYRYTGPRPGPGFSPGDVDATAVGSATITFTTDSTAVMSYNFDGLSGQLNLQRFTFSSLSLNGNFAAVLGSAITGCQDPYLNGSGFVDLALATLTTNGNQLQATLLVGDEQGQLICTLTANHQQKGSVIEGGGNWSCESGLGPLGGPWSLRDLRVGPDFISFKADLQMTVGETCRWAIVAGGTRLQ